MTLPKIDDDQRAAAFNRGNHFRRIGEFDKALAVYERIVQEDETDAEAHWGCALCRFGIEYVEDPETYEWLPTCHRASFDSFLEDVDYSRPIAMKIYRRILQLRPEWKEKVGVVMTSGNNDPEDWREIIGTKAHKDELARKFKDNNDPMKIAIVVDMWLTGFDVPSLATMYVYKPMHGYNLMQAIARVNRVFQDKEGGLIVDYVGIASALKAAMNEYSPRDRQNFGDMDIAKVAYPKFREKLQGMPRSVLWI